MKRRAFITTVPVLLGAAGCSRQAGDEKTKTQTSSKKYKWKMVTCWPRGLPGTGQIADYFAETVGKITQGRLTIKVYGARELVPAFEVFDAVQNGGAQMTHSASYYWKGKNRSFYFFAGVPTGMTSAQMNAWLYHGGGLKLWNEVCEPFNLVPIPVGNTGMQMGGWFREPLTGLDSLKGLKIRIPGLGAAVLEKLGAIPVLIPGGELFTSFQTGVIDAVEWSIPASDYALGLHKLAKNYYYPAWQEPGVNLECLVNGDAYRSLPEDLQTALWLAAEATTLHGEALIRYQNLRAVREMEENHGVILRAFSPDMLSAFKSIATEVLDEVATSSPQALAIYNAYRAFQDDLRKWGRFEIYDDIAYSE